MRFRLPKKFNLSRLRGEANIYIVAILGAIVVMSFFMIGGITPALESPDANSKVVEPDIPEFSGDKRSSLQLQSFGYKTPTPPQVSPTPKPCLANTAIDLLVDLSSSMNNAGKAQALESALLTFSNSLTDDTVIGIHVFGSPFQGGFPPTGAAERLPFIRYGSDKTRVTNAITALDPGASGGTHMKSGFDVSLSAIRSAKTNPALAGYQFVTILFSDGVPEVSGHYGDQCVAQSGTLGTNSYVCFAEAQDPRLFGLDASMKQEASKVYSIAIYDPTPGGREANMIPYLRDLLQDNATDRTAPYYQETTTSNASQLTPIFQSIIKGICG